MELPKSRCSILYDEDKKQYVLILEEDEYKTTDPPGLSLVRWEENGGFETLDAVLEYAVEAWGYDKKMVFIQFSCY